MKRETLEKANELYRKIKDLEYARNSFEWRSVEGLPNAVIYTRNPRVIIECDDGEDGKEQNKIPVQLNQDMIAHLKQFIEKSLTEVKEELEKL